MSLTQKEQTYVWQKLNSNKMHLCIPPSPQFHVHKKDIHFIQWLIASGKLVLLMLITTHSLTVALPHPNCKHNRWGSRSLQNGHQSCSVKPGSVLHYFSSWGSDLNPQNLWSLSTKADFRNSLLQIASKELFAKQTPYSVLHKLQSRNLPDTWNHFYGKLTKNV